MKTNLRFFTVLVIIMSSCMMLPRQTVAQNSNVSFQLFYDELSPYGQWVDDYEYGYVWIPDYESNFTPYSTNGRWILTEYGWTWASYYDWGWAPFHYGRWSFNDSFGWFWVPDNEWGPAWVNWRQAEGYYGWSPMEPGMSISISFGRRYDSSNDHWMFVRSRDIDRTNIYQYYVSNEERYRIGRNSTVINNTYVDQSRHTTYVTGPARTDVQRRTGRQIAPVAIRENSRPGKDINNGRLQIYRPRIEKANNDRKPAPSRVVNRDDVKRSPVRQVSNPTQNVNRNNKTDRPANPAIKKNSNVQPREGQVDRNRKVEQNRTATPSRNERKVQTTEPTRSTPSNNRPERRSTEVNGQNNNSQPNQQRNVSPRNNNEQQKQQRNDVQQNNREEQKATPPAAIESNTQREQPRNVSPSNDRKPEKESKSIRQKVQKNQDKMPDKETENNRK